MATIKSGSLASTSHLTHNGLRLGEKSRLRGRIVRVADIAQADANQPKPLVRAEADTFPQPQGDIRELLARSRRRTWRTTVRAIRDSLREAAHVCSASLRIIGSISVSKTSCSKVSSADMDCVGLSETTSLLSIPGPTRRDPRHSGRSGLRVSPNPFAAGRRSFVPQGASVFLP